ncbi:MAG TPA: nitroreductase family protein [Actinomycetota bacterium]|nr:nitroreductase family protein [Actinomycetota bacterium]
MDFARVVKARRMCRGYLERDVTDDQIERIIELASRFPSAGHTQPQEFIVVRDQTVKDQLAKAALDQMFIAQAPVVIVVVSDTRRSAQRYGRRGVDFYSILDGGFASMLVLLSAVDDGLGAAFVAAFDDDAVAEVLGLPRKVRPIGIIPIGYCAEPSGKYRRRPRAEIVHAERWTRS